MRYNCLAMKKQVLVLIIGLLAGLCGCNSPGPDDSAQPQTSAYIENKGSDTMVNIALLWAEQYQAEKPEVRISVTGGGSGTGLAAMTNGTTDIANASRQIKPEEIETAQENGYNPVEFVVARDAVAVIINPENKINELTLEQVSKIYRGEYNNWEELGGDNHPIVRLSRETNSGTHVYFLESVIRLGQKENKSLFAQDTLLLPSSEGIISEVRSNPNAIGYDGLGYVTPEVKVVAVAEQPQGAYVLPSSETVNDNTYPIARDLYMYTLNEPQGPVKDYIEWIYSSQAQQIVNELGFVPID